MNDGVHRMKFVGILELTTKAELCRAGFLQGEDRLDLQRRMWQVVNS